MSASLLTCLYHKCIFIHASWFHIEKPIESGLSLLGDALDAQNTVKRNWVLLKMQIIVTLLAHADSFEVSSVAEDFYFLWFEGSIVQLG